MSIDFYPLVFSTVLDIAYWSHFCPVINFIHEQITDRYE